MFASKDTLLTRPSGYTIARSVRLRSSATAYFSRTPASASNRKTWTWSGWVKRGDVSGSAQQCLFAVGAGTTDSTFFQFTFSTANTLYFANYTASTFLQTTQVFRDPSAWYHIVVAFDTTQATSSNRAKIYVNGTQVTSLLNSSYPSLNDDTALNSTGVFNIGRLNQGGGLYNFDGYLTEINFVDGQQLTPSSFGETDSITGVWKPKAYSGTYGTNGFELNFSDNSSNTATTIGKDYSGNGNNWTPNNISVTAGSTYDSMTDVPTLTSATAANYATLNPVNLGGTSITLSNGNLFATFAGASWFTTSSTMGMVGSGKYYFEYTKTDTSSQMVGIFPPTASISSFVGNDANGYGYFSANGYLYNNGGSSITFGATFTTGDVIGVAFDASTGKLWFSKNNTWQASGDPSAGTSPAATASTAYTYVAAFSTNGSGVGTVNFGQRPFSYTPPTGFVALNTYNLPASTIKNGAAYMAATTYTGNGSTQTITNTVNSTSFQPDLVWIKNRSSTYSNYVFDSVRGLPLMVYTNGTAAETSYNTISSLNSNGFTVTTTGGSGTNANTETFVGWQWKAGGTSSSNTNGSITSTVSVGATQGFSVVTWTANGSASTVGHGLGVTPSMIIAKSRIGSWDWKVYHTSIGNTGALTLNTTAATDTYTYWNNTSPTSTVFSLGTSGSLNTNTNTMVAYCFAAVAGYSAFGSYTGNGSTDGPFVYTGFRPRWLMIKRSSAVNNWVIQDTSRSVYNVSQNNIYADSSGAEASYASELTDILSNGFKQRETGVSMNGSGSTYIYMAFAENPFKNSLAR